MQSPKPTGFKAWLGKPSTGPSISLVVLAVALVALGFNYATYQRQGERWAAEDGNAFQLNSSIETGLTNGSRTGYSLFYYGREPMRVQKLEVISPDDVTIALVRDGKTLAPLARSITLDAVTGTAPQAPVTMHLAVRSSQTPGNDQGTVIELKATAIELTGEKRTIERRGKVVIPPDAIKMP